MAESSSSPQPNQPYRPRQTQQAKKSNPLGCLLPLGVAAFFFAQQYLPGWSWAIVFGFIFVAIVASSSRNAKNKRQRAAYQAGQPAQASPSMQQPRPTQAPPPQAPRQQYQLPPTPQQFQIQVPPARPQPVPQPRPQQQPQPRQQQQRQAQPRPAQAPRKAPAQQPMRPVPGTEHLAPALIGRVTELKLKGQTVEAIETLREATAMELYEASQIVRRLGQPAEAAVVGDSGDVESKYLDTFDTSDPYEKADAELERKWKQADEELDRAWQRELEQDSKKWDED